MFYGKNQEHAFGILRNILKLKQLLPLILGSWTLNWGAWDKDSFCPQTQSSFCSENILTSGWQSRVICKRPYFLQKI